MTSCFLGFPRPETREFTKRTISFSKKPTLLRNNSQRTADKTPGHHGSYWDAEVRRTNSTWPHPTCTCRQQGSKHFILPWQIFSVSGFSSSHCSLTRGQLQHAARETKSADEQDQQKMPHRAVRSYIAAHLYMSCFTSARWFLEASYLSGGM